MDARSQTEAICKFRTIRENYAWNALLLCLNLLGDFKSSVADELLRRDLDLWYQHILIGLNRLRNLPLPSRLQGKSQEDLQILPLLHELYNISGGTTDQRNQFNPCLTDLTPLDNLILYGLACGVQTPIAHEFGTCDFAELQKALSRSRMFVQTTGFSRSRATTVEKVAEWSSDLKRSLPIAFPYLGIPSRSLNEFGFRQVKHIQVFCAHTFHELPSLNHSENHILALLVSSFDCRDGALESLQAWAITEDGQLLYQRLIQDLRLPKSPAEIALILAALLSFTKLHTDENTSNEENHLSDFVLLLEGLPSSSVQWTLKHMIWGVWMVITSQLDATECQKICRILALVVDPSEDVPSREDQKSSFYWQDRFSPRRSHEEALRKNLDSSRAGSDKYAYPRR